MRICHALFIAFIMCVAGLRGYIEGVSTEQGLVQECKSLYHPAFFNGEPYSIGSYLNRGLGSESDTS